MNFETQKLRLYFLDSAKTLGEVGELALGYLMEDAGIDDKWDVPLQKRLRWVQGSQWTLEEAAEIVGVTRERMRQIQKQIGDYRLDLPTTPRPILKVLYIAETVGGIKDFWDGLEDEDLIGLEDSWDIQSLLEFFSVLTTQENMERLARRLGQLAPPQASKRISRIIRDVRVEMLGLVDVVTAMEKAELSRADLLSVVNSMYPHVVDGGEILLAVMRPPGGFIATVGRQLLVNRSLRAEVLAAGLARYGSGRGIEIPFSNNELANLIGFVFGDPPSLGNLPAGLAEGLQLTEYEQEFLVVFKMLGRNALHRDEIIEHLTRRGFHAGSAGVYLSTSPIIRPSRSRRGYFQIV